MQITKQQPLGQMKSIVWSLGKNFLKQNINFFTLAKKFMLSKKNKNLNNKDNTTIPSLENKDTHKNQKYNYSNNKKNSFMVKKPLIAIVRLKGKFDLTPKVKKTLKILQLDRINTCRVTYLTKPLEKQLQTIYHTISWGYVSNRTVVKLLLKYAHNLTMIKEKQQTPGRQILHNTIENNRDTIQNIQEGIQPVNYVMNLPSPKKHLSRKQKDFTLSQSIMGFQGYQMDKILKKIYKI
mmetsp:Transcript_7817/g.11792  ORF Transcript_7817/g.11792 Transcript_7817/m.11792 type:complete len:237 (-) Transcript_7817:11-721(-)